MQRRDGNETVTVVTDRGTGRRRDAMLAGLIAILTLFQVGCGGGGGAPDQQAAGAQPGAAAPQTADQAATDQALGGNQMFTAVPNGTTGATGATGMPGATSNTSPTSDTANTSPTTTGASGATQVAGTTGTSGASGTAGNPAAPNPSGAVSPTGQNAPPAGSNSFSAPRNIVAGTSNPTPSPTQTPSGGGGSQPSGEQLASNPKPSQPSGGLGSPSEKKQPPPPPNPLRDRGSGPGCFTEGTLVLTPRGLVAIESLVAGDMVLAPAKSVKNVASASADGAAAPTGPTQARRIVRTTKLPNDHKRILEIRDAAGHQSRIETTEGHPFWVEGKGWTRAMDLVAGQTLSRSEGYAVVEKTTLEEHPEGLWVYNLEVEGTRTYQVSPLGIVVQGW